MSKTTKVPLFIEKCIAHVEQEGTFNLRKGLDSQGIYRLSGNASTVQKYKAQLNQGDYTDIFEAHQDVNVIAALLKRIYQLI